MEQVLFEYGPLGLMIVGLAWYARAERQERRDAQESEKQTYQSVLPAVEALERAVKAALEHVGK